MMKKLCVVFTLVLLATELFASAQKESSAISTLSGIDGRAVAIIGANFDVTPAFFDGHGYTPSSVLSFDSGPEALAALKAGKADAWVGLMMSLANYYARNDAGLLAIPDPAFVSYDLSLTVAEDNTKLLNALNQAIAKIKADGTLEQITQTYFIQGNTEGAAFPAPVAGQETVIIGLPGDGPPIDYIAPDGKPSGFNLALSSAIAKAAGFNIELVLLPYGVQDTALISGRIDAYLFRFNDVPPAKGVVLTAPYMEKIPMGTLVRGKK
jgi:ABC-type amino acid transport substrate-binding protein